MAKRHFRRYIEAGSTNPKVNQWNLFTSELGTVFGDLDRMGRASGKILGLQMKETILFSSKRLPTNSVGQRMFYINSITSAFQIVSRTSGPDPICLPASVISFVKLNAPTIATGNALTKRRSPMPFIYVPQTRSQPLKHRAAPNNPNPRPPPLSSALPPPPLLNPIPPPPLAPTPSQRLTPKTSRRSLVLMASSCQKRRPDERNLDSAHTAEVSTRLTIAIPSPQVLRRKTANPPTKPLLRYMDAGLRGQGLGDSRKFR